ncbi:DUF3039 domain-containing protein [Nocardia asteroides]|uniref:DUF3039 domain-containing protein n=1 Tax=Nocardia asteroides TaxID=1824 RepID=UPI001E5564E2|nr:DUF3039 domain-containing protein [Nocardia asteroides]UGT64100.1 DUF3039 domain-containing protein [Nocardia asteroides]
MEHNRRARPTLRLLTDDLPTGWANPDHLRLITEGRWQQLHPLAELSHPLLRKAVDLYGSDPLADPAPRLIKGSGELRLQELRNAQWRAGIWTDPDSGVRWVVSAGLAKGGHRDEDDFYQVLERRIGSGSATLLPTEHDALLLKRETAAAALTRWHLKLQSEVAQALGSLERVASTRISLPHPSEPGAIGTVEIELDIVREDGTPREDFFLTFDLRSEHRVSTWGWRAIERVLISVAPPVQDWDRHGNHYFVMTEPGHRSRQYARLGTAGSRKETLFAEQGTVSHYTHKSHIAEASVAGTAVRAMCGVVFVPTRDPDPLTVCPRCAENFAALPG